MAKQSKGTIIIESAALQGLFCPVPEKFQARRGPKPPLTNFIDSLEFLGEQGYKVVITQETSARAGEILCGLKSEALYPNLQYRPPSHLEPHNFRNFQNWLEKLHSRQYRGAIDLIDESGHSGLIESNKNNRPALRNYFNSVRRPENELRSIRDYIAHHPDEQCFFLENARKPREAIAREGKCQLLNITGFLLALQGNHLFEHLGLDNSRSAKDLAKYIHFTVTNDTTETAQIQSPIDCISAEDGRFPKFDDYKHPFAESLTGISQKLSDVQKSNDPAAQPAGENIASAADRSKLGVVSGRSRFEARLKKTIELQSKKDQGDANAGDRTDGS